MLLLLLLFSFLYFAINDFYQILFDFLDDFIFVFSVFLIFMQLHVQYFIIIVCLFITFLQHSCIGMHMNIVLLVQEQRFSRIFVLDSPIRNDVRMMSPIRNDAGMMSPIRNDAGMMSPIRNDAGMMSPILQRFSKMCTTLAKKA